MTATRPYIIYTLPKSRTTQALLGGKIEKVWANIDRFLSNCTNANINNPHSIDLTGYTADENNNEILEPAENLIRETQELFGTGNTKPIGYLWPANTPLKQTKTEWKLTPKDLDKALNYIISGQPYPKYNLGPIELIISYDFKLVEIQSKSELPNQQYTSSLLLWLSRNKSVAPSLCFPFVEPAMDFWDYINGIEKFMPFKFDKKYLRLGRSNKKGTSNIFSKL